MNFGPEVFIESLISIVHHFFSGSRIPCPQRNQQQQQKEQRKGEEPNKQTNEEKREVGRILSREVLRSWKENVGPWRITPIHLAMVFAQKWTSLFPSLGNERNLSSGQCKQLQHSAKLFVPNAFCYTPPFHCVLLLSMLLLLRSSFLFQFQSAIRTRADRQNN